MQLLQIGVTASPGRGTFPLPMVAREKSPPEKGAEERPYASFGLVVAEKLDRAQLSNVAAARALGVTVEMIRRYREGMAMPRDQKMAKLAKLIGVSPSELRYGSKAKNKEHPLPLSKLSPEDRAMLEEYQQLPDFARKMARARIIELLEEFGAPGKKNPYGKGGGTQ